MKENYYLLCEENDCNDCLENDCLLCEEKDCLENDFYNVSDFYKVAGALQIYIRSLFEKYKELYPNNNVSDYDYSHILKKDEIEELRKYFIYKAEYSINKYRLW